ncbi:MAG: hypothetical protein AB1757_06105 [Acidobacteriota bacterium]
MKKLSLSALAILALLLISLSPLTESTAIAATKKSSCSCSKPTIKKKARRATKKATPAKTVAVQGDAYADPTATAGVLGPAYATYTLPENQYIRLRLNSTVGSAISRAGDRFTATVITPVYASGIEVIPAGATIEGRVASAVAARTRGREGQLSLAFDTLLLPDGTRKQLTGDLTEVQDQKAGDVDSESGVKGRSSDDRNVKYVGGGGIGGAILGGVIGGGKGAAIGGAIGAGAGVAGVLMTKGNEVTLRGGTEIGLVTAQPIEFTVRADKTR